MSKKADSKGSASKGKGKKKKKKKKKNPVAIAFFSIFLVILVGTGVFAFNLYSLYKLGGIKEANIGPKTVINIAVKKGATAKEIAQSLKRGGVVDDANLFYLKAKKDGIAENFKAGEFELDTNMNYDQVVSILQNPSQIKGIKLLVKEGDTQEDIARNLSSMGIISYDEFMSACNDITYDYPFLKGLPDAPERTSKLEGYLYPDTYFLSSEETGESIVNKMLTRFNELYTQEISKKAKALNLTTDQVITIASIVEKEVKIPTEKPIVASVIFNRLKQGMKLQMDATVIYAKKQHTDRVLISDTKLESAYNTYYTDALPIGPICNPSIDTIKAVVNPARTDYIYYVVKDISSGEHFFTGNYDEFLDAKEKYVRNFN